MSSNPRDKQFTGYAKLLHEELKPYLTALSLALGSKNTRDLEWAEHMIQSIMAQRAYDLALHIASHVTEGDIASMDAGMSTVQQCVNAIPDLTQWPTKGKA